MYCFKGYFPHIPEIASWPFEADCFISQTTDIVPEAKPNSHCTGGNNRAQTQKITEYD